MAAPVVVVDDYQPDWPARAAALVEPLAHALGETWARHTRWTAWSP